MAFNWLIEELDFFRLYLGCAVGLNRTLTFQQKITDIYVANFELDEGNESHQHQ